MDEDAREQVKEDTGERRRGGGGLKEGELETWRGQEVEEN